MSLKLNIKLGPRARQTKWQILMHITFSITIFFLFFLVFFQYLTVMTLKSRVKIRQLQYIRSQLHRQL